jgi:hypothetical protein
MDYAGDTYIMQPTTEAERKQWAHLVVHKKRGPYDVYVGRPTKWGNPYHLNCEGSRDNVCDRHEAHVSGNPELVAQLHELKGKVLACWCSPKRCHAHTLAALANRADSL